MVKEAAQDQEAQIKPFPATDITEEKQTFVKTDSVHKYTFNHEPRNEDGKKKSPLTHSAYALISLVSDAFPSYKHASVHLKLHQ